MIVPVVENLTVDVREVIVEGEVLVTVLAEEIVEVADVMVVTV